MNHCQNCTAENNNGTKFCSRKCRQAWKVSHEIKGAKKKANERKEKALMNLGNGFNNESASQNRS
jgi:predicted nucleic acid-binding Zn ribbon protein